MLNIPYQDLWIQYVSMHHFGWVVKAIYQVKDMMPEILDQFDNVPELPVDASIARAIGGIPTFYLNTTITITACPKNRNQKIACVRNS